jgi:hypothetical protein
VSIVGSRESDGWEMKVLGPDGFERSYTLVGTAGASAFNDRERAPEIAAGEGDARVRGNLPYLEGVNMHRGCHKIGTKCWD